MGLVAGGGDDVVRGARHALGEALQQGAVGVRRHLMVTWGGGGTRVNQSHAQSTNTT